MSSPLRSPAPGPHPLTPSPFRRGGTKGWVITLHALRRFIERYAGIEDLEPGQYRPFLRAELERGLQWGGQSGKGQLYWLPCGLVAAVMAHNGRAFVKTILTREQAIANM